MRIFVFDLDFTLWNAGDTFCSETDPPYYWSDGKLLDQENRWIRLFPDTIPLLSTLFQKDVIIASASRTYSPENADQLLHLLGIKRFFHHQENYPGSKVAHLKAIQSKYSQPFNQIYFFDDEQRNIDDALSLGVISTLVEDGISAAQVMKYL